jgi:hypothetical protein
MARILARFTPEMVSALAEQGRFSDPSDTAFIATVLNGRLQRILERYLTHLSPLADVRVSGSNQLCALDLARVRQLRSAAAFRYSAVSAGHALPVTTQSDGTTCVTLPRSSAAADPGVRDDAPERYLVVTIANGVAQGPLIAHLYDLGPTRGYRLVGLERPEK